MSKRITLNFEIELKNILIYLTHKIGNFQIYFFDSSGKKNTLRSVVGAYIQIYIAIHSRE